MTSLPNDDFYPFINFDTLAFDPTKLPDYMSTIGSKFFSELYYPEVFEYLVENDFILPKEKCLRPDEYKQNMRKLIARYKERNNEGCPENVVFTRMVPDNKSGFSRWRQKNFLAVECGKEGRKFANVPLAGLQSVYRSTVQKHCGYTNLDAISCHPSLILHLMKRAPTHFAKIDVMWLEQFLSNKEERFKQWAEELTDNELLKMCPGTRRAVSPLDVKLIVNSLCYFGHLPTRIHELTKGEKRTALIGDNNELYEGVVAITPCAVKSKVPKGLETLSRLLDTALNTIVNANVNRKWEFLDETQIRRRVEKNANTKSKKNGPLGHSTHAVSVEEKAKKSLVSALLQSMEHYAIYRIFYEDLPAQGFYWAHDMSWEWDGCSVRLHDALRAKELEERANSFYEASGLRFKIKEYDVAVDDPFVLNFFTSKPQPMPYDEVVRLAKEVVNTHVRPSASPDESSGKRRRVVPSESGEGFAAVDARFAQECVFLEQLHQYVVLKQPDPYGRRLWSAPFSNERLLFSHFKEWTFEETVVSKDGETNVEVKSFIEEKLKKSNTTPFRKLNDLTWLPRKDTPVVGIDLNTFGGLMFDGFVSGPEDPNWNDDAIKVLQKQLCETFELHDGETRNEEGFAPGAVLFIDSWTALANHPEQKLGFMIFLYSAEGGGKTRLLEFLANCFGREYLTTAKSNLADITGQFNGHLERKLIINIPEPEEGLNEATLRAVMNLVTDQSVSTERKRIQKENDAINYVHPYACINKLSTAFDNGDILQRRWRIVHMNQALKDDVAHCQKMDNYHRADKIFENRYALASLFWWIKNRNMTVRFNALPDAPVLVKAAENREAPAVMFFKWLKRKLITDKVKCIRYEVNATKAIGVKDVCYTTDHLWKMYEAWFQATYEKVPKMVLGTATSFTSQFGKVASIYIAPETGVDIHPEISKFIRKDRVDLRGIENGRKVAYIFDLIKLLNDEVLEGGELVVKRDPQSSSCGYHDTFIKTTEMKEGREVKEYSPLVDLIEMTDNLARDQFKTSVSDLKLANGVPHRAYKHETVSLTIEGINLPHNCRNFSAIFD